MSTLLNLGPNTSNPPGTNAGHWESSSHFHVKKTSVWNHQQSHDWPYPQYLSICHHVSGLNPPITVVSSKGEPATGPALSIWPFRTRVERMGKPGIPGIPGKPGSWWVPEDIRYASQGQFLVLSWWIRSYQDHCLDTSQNISTIDHNQPYSPKSSVVKDNVQLWHEIFFRSATPKKITNPSPNSFLLVPQR